MDILPFVIALRNFIDIYNAEGIDIFKDYVTLPRVARKMLYESSDSEFSLINQENADLYYTIKNIAEGPSIIFSRYQVLFLYLFGILHRFQHCTGHVMTGSWKGRGNQYIQLARERCYKYKKIIKDIDNNSNNIDNNKRYR